MNAISDFGGLEKTKKRLEKLNLEKRELAVKISMMNRTPKYDPSYSGARLANWQADFEKLEKDEVKLLEELTAIKNSPGFLKTVNEKKTALNVKRKKLQDELVVAHDLTIDLQSNLTNRLIDGGDPLKLVSDIKLARERELLIVQAIDALAGVDNEIVRLS
jgi:hypothetical protein